MYFFRLRTICVLRCVTRSRSTTRTSPTAPSRRPGMTHRDMSVELISFFLKKHNNLKLAYFQLQCCGMNISSLEYKPWLAWKLNHRVNPTATDRRVPASCCRVNPITGVAADCSTANPVDPNDVWPGDCFSRGLEFVKGHAVYLFAVALAIAIMMVN